VLGLLSTAVAEAVVAQPVPFWRLLLSRVVTAGATAVLHVPEGPPPRALPAGVIAVQRAEDIPRALREARSGRGEESTQPHVAPTIEQRVAEAERFSAEVQALHLLRAPEEIAWEAVRRVRGLVQADRVLCWRIGDDTTLVLGAADPALPAPPASMPIGELLAGACAADAAPVSRGEAEVPDSWREAARRRDGAEPGRCSPSRWSAPASWWACSRQSAAPLARPSPTSTASASPAGAPRSRPRSPER
jgi:hypothetical protein